MKRGKPGKLLGLTADYRTAFPPPIPYDSDAAISAAAALLCELKRSSSVNNSIGLRLSNHPREAKLEAMNEEQMSGFENRFEDKNGEEKEETAEIVEEKKGQGRKGREKEMESSGSGAMIKCKKTDGKGWHCKRLAQNAHSLCSYHLTQLRSYRDRFEDQVSGDHHRKKSAFAVGCGGAASNDYYYYSILGPWWGKRRGPVNESSEWNEANMNSSKDCNGKSADNDAAVDVDTVDEEEEKEEEDSGDSYGDVTYMKKKKTKRMIKRKGRKPVKARSLKSLL